MMGSRETMAKSASRDLSISLPTRTSSTGTNTSSASPVSVLQVAVMCRRGASCSFEQSSWHTISPWCETFNIPVPSALPRRNISVSYMSAIFCNSGTSASFTAITMRSWDSLMKICQLKRSCAFKGAFSSQISPPDSLSISPAALLKPPAPQSVTNWIRPFSRAAMMKSPTFFSSMGLPICTAVWSSSWLAVVRLTLEKVAPLSPSLPVRPPAAMRMWPGFTSLAMSAIGITPMVPQNTRGL